MKTPGQIYSYLQAQPKEVLQTCTAISTAADEHYKEDVQIE